MQQIDVDFGFAEQFTYWTYRADEVAMAREDPGLYAWFLRIPSHVIDEDACSPFRSVFSERRFDVSVSAALGEQMAGRIKRQPPFIKGVKTGQELDRDFFSAAFAAFSPPVYIGRSRGVRTRLRSHMRALSAELERGLPPDHEIREKARPDSDEESAQFGQRMGYLLRSQGVTDHRSLYAKVVYAPSNAATIRSELLLNRTFHPVLGRL